MPTSRNQALDALATAQRVRAGRATIKRSIRSGALHPSRVIEAPPAELATMRVGDLLRSQHRWGKARTRKLLGRARVAEGRMLGALSPRERRDLVIALSTL